MNFAAYLYLLLYEFFVSKKSKGGGRRGEKREMQLSKDGCFRLLGGGGGIKWERYELHRVVNTYEGGTGLGAGEEMTSRYITRQPLIPLKLDFCRTWD
ncbi:hypothetical protein CDAR_569171 [Caerostris darwini]|uniref:Uncharacterized protein n=1 Tax=Caerostris darwini TaxID=1538125 RepID=A0AAV4QDC1_9ARAC|nr:hypothetical protein CDAR_569171 [Caerostris darwini]